MPTYTLVITPEMEGKPVRRAAMGGIGLSGGQFKRAKFHGEIRLDGERVTADVRNRAGQTLSVFVPEVENTLPEPADIPFDILYEDEYFWIINKPAPLPTASSVKQDGFTLENALFYRLGCPQDFVYRPVNRLDKGTSGLMLAARTAHAQHLLQQMLHGDEFIREYVALVEGAPEEDEFVIDRPIGKADGATVRREVRPDGKPARTFCQVLQRGERSLVRLRLDTGRTHQIRVHMQSIGCPVVGDFLYGTEDPAFPGRFALHSAYVRVKHPITGEWIEREGKPPFGLRFEQEGE